MSNENPLVSVVMPVFNGLPWLSEAIESILSQTYSNLEFVVVDDCSTDGSFDLLEKYASKDARIQLLKNSENMGVPRTLNKGVAAARGKYLARMDSDDVSLPGRIELQVKYMEDHPECGVVGSWIYRLRKKGDTRLKRFPERDADLKLLLLFECCFSHPSVMIRRSTLEGRSPIYNESFRSAQDYDLWARLSGFCEFHCIQEPLLRYRELESSVSQQAKKKNEKRQRVAKIIGYLFDRAGLAESCNYQFHLDVLNRVNRSGIKPRDLADHLNCVFNAFPEATIQDEIRQNIFAQYRKNPIFHIKYLVSKMRW